MPIKRLGVAVERADRVTPDAGEDANFDCVEVEDSDLKLTGQAHGREDAPVHEKRLIRTVEYVRKNLRLRDRAAGSATVRGQRVDRKLRTTTDGDRANSETKVRSGGLGVNAEQIDGLGLKERAHGGDHRKHAILITQNVYLTSDLLPTAVGGKAIASGVGLDATLAGVELVSAKPEGRDSTVISSGTSASHLGSVLPKASDLRTTVRSVSHSSV